MNIEKITVENAVGDCLNQVIVTNDDGTQTAYTQAAFDAMQANSTLPSNSSTPQAGA